MAEITLTNVASKETADQHYDNVSNPHLVTKLQVGLGNAENTTDLGKPVSTAQQTAINLAISNLRDGVATTGDTLQKLYNIIIGQTKEVTVTDITARNALDITSLPTNVFVLNDGDATWALYKATTTGVGATYIKLSDPDLLNAVMSAATIKSSYESNADTNAFTNDFKAIVQATSGTNTGDNATNSQYSGLAASKQDLDSDLTAIAALSPSNDDLLQRKLGVWTNRTPAQVKTDLAVTYNLPFNGSFFSPADSTTYVHGGLFTTPPLAASGGTGRRIYIPKTGTLVGANVYILVATTLGSAENVGLYVRLNNTSDVTLTTTSVWNSTFVSHIITGLSQAVTAGDYVEIKIVTPAWGTNPIDVYIVGNLTIQQ